MTTPTRPTQPAATEPPKTTTALACGRGNAGFLADPGSNGLSEVPAADLVLPPSAALAVVAALGSAFAKESQRAYEREWKQFVAYCEREARQSLPASAATVAAFLTERCARRSKAVLEQARAAIANAHRIARFVPPTDDPQVRILLKGLRRQAAQRRRAKGKDPLTYRELEAVLANVDTGTLDGLRDRALILLGVRTAMRRSELVAVRVEEIEEVEEDGERGIVITIPRSKTDQEGEGQTVAVVEDGGPFCAVSALRAWRRAAGIASGPVFRGFRLDGAIRESALHPGEVARIVKHYAAMAELDAAKFAGHSLRAGHVTEAYRQGVPEAQIMAQTRHTSVGMLARYRREGLLKRGSANLTRFE